MKIDISPDLALAIVQLAPVIIGGVKKAFADENPGAPEMTDADAVAKLEADADRVVQKIDDARPNLRDVPPAL